MHRHDQHVEACFTLVDAAPLVTRSKSGYRASQKLKDPVTGAREATAYHHASYTNILFYGERAEEQARAYAKCTGGAYKPEDHSGVIRHVVRFDY